MFSTAPRRRTSNSSLELSRFSTRTPILSDESRVPLAPPSQRLLATSPDGKTTTSHGVGTPGMYGAPLPNSRLLGSPASKFHLRHVSRRIAKLRLVVVLLGSLLLVGSVAFLSFLWSESKKAQDGGNPHKLWQDIVFSGWMTRAVTTTAVLLRSVITAQATIIAAMTAALCLESSGVQISQLPLFSFARTVNLSPVSLAMPILAHRSLSTGAMYAPFVFLTCILMVGSQFSSTILLSDFRDARIARPVNDTTRAVLPEGARVTNGISFWESAPNAFWRFAEETSPEEQLGPSNISDTGVVLRAAIPWADSATRTNLAAYTGVAPVTEDRVVCISPSLKNVTVVLHSVDSSTSARVEAKAVQGFVTADGLPGDLPDGVRISPTLQGRVFFSCTVGPNGTVTICRTDDSIFKLHSRLKVAKLGTFTQGYMVLSADGLDYMSSPTVTEDDLLQIPDAVANLTNSPVAEYNGWSWRQNGPWTGLSKPSVPGVGFSLSLCSANIVGCSVNVTMTGKPTDAEPTFRWTLADDGRAGESNTTDVRRHLGATSRRISPQDRGLLSLQAPPTFETCESNTIITMLSKITLYIGLARGYIPPADVQVAHELHSVLFLDILRYTGSPALALQALLTVYHQMNYYDSSYRWTKEFPSSYVVFTAMSIPVRQVGFYCIVAMVCFHFAVLAITLLLFLWNTEASSLGNSWQAVAQIVSDDTLPILAAVNDLNDKEVKKLIADPDEGSQALCVVRRRTNGQNELKVK